MVSIAYSALQRLNITAVYQTISGCLLGLNKEARMRPQRR